MLFADCCNGFMWTTGLWRDYCFAWFHNWDFNTGTRITYSLEICIKLSQVYSNNCRVKYGFYSRLRVIDWPHVSRRCCGTDCWMAAAHVGSVQSCHQAPVTHPLSWPNSRGSFSLVQHTAYGNHTNTDYSMSDAQYLITLFRIRLKTELDTQLKAKK